MSIAARLKEAQQTEERSRLGRRTSRREEQKEAIEENTFYKILFDEDLEPEEKSKQVAQELVFTDDKEAARAKVIELDSFKEFMQGVSEELSKKRIALTNTQVFADLQKMYGEYNDDLEDFHRRLQPLIRIIDALYKMRQEGTTDSILEKVNNEKRLDAEQKARLVELADLLKRNEDELAALKETNFELMRQRTWFGLGSITPEAKARITDNENIMANMTTVTEEISKEIEALNLEIAKRAENVDESFEYQELKNLLNLNSEGHTKQQAELIEAALHFIESGKERFTSVCEILQDMSNQIQGLSDNNSKMIQTYAILNDSAKIAEDENLKIKQNLDAKLTDFTGSALEKMALETKRNDMNEHIDAVVTSSADTTTSYAELSKEQITLNNMKSSTKRQSDSAKIMNSRGIAKMASSVCTTLTAINSAGVNESQARGKQMLEKLGDITLDITKKDVIREAMGKDEINIELEKIFIDLEDLGNIQRDGTKISREAVETMRDNLEALKQMSEGVLEDVAEANAVASDTLEKKSTKTKTKTTTKKSSPFA